MVVLQPVMILFVAVSIIALHSFLLSYVLFPLSTIMESRFGQEAKAPIPILVTEDGMMTEVILLHPTKQSFPMLRKEEQRNTLLKLLPDIDQEHYVQSS